jgi:hypothetical protein
MDITNTSSSSKVLSKEERDGIGKRIGSHTFPGVKDIEETAGIAL